MSVINQVLNQLEQRGVHTAPEQTMVRVVPHGKRRYTLPLLAAGLALASGFAAWQWMQMRQPKAVVTNTKQQPVITATPAPVSAVSPAPVLEVASSAIGAASAASAVSAVSADEAPPAELLTPASRLSFELSSVPLPSSLRELKNSAGAEGVEETAPKTAPLTQIARPKPEQAAPRQVHASVPPPNDALQMKHISPAQLSDAEFRKAVSLMQHGHIADAIAGYEAVLRLDAGHDAARQALVALLLESKRGVEAGRVLQDGLKAKPEHTGFAMLLARLQVEQGAVERAITTLEKSLPYADAQADYQAFFAALLQRQNRHKEALTHYQMALQLAPGNGIWLMGYGISLQAVQRGGEARNAYERALGSGTLSPELQAFVQMKIKEL